MPTIRHSQRLQQACTSQNLAVQLVLQHVWRWELVHNVHACGGSGGGHRRSCGMIVAGGIITAVADAAGDALPAHATRGRVKDARLPLRCWKAAAAADIARLPHIINPLNHSPCPWT